MNRSAFSRWLQSRMKLHREEDETATIQEIWDGINLNGHNFWIMAFAMVIACIGLNTNSMSAIIGAMLISPLMGPVTGYSFALATRNGPMRNKAIRSFLTMTGISLSASTVYFLLSPFENNTEALFSYSHASIFDILIAFFGGMAGFIGLMKRDGVKVMAGVAVATACMPPLCTAGFGLAHGIWTEFAGGMYFYTINSLFIGLATYVLARLTGYHHDNKEQEKKSVLSISLWTLFILCMIAPGVYIAAEKWKAERQAQTIRETPEQGRIRNLELQVKRLDSLVLTTSNH